MCSQGRLDSLHDHRCVSLYLQLRPEQDRASLTLYSLPPLLSSVCLCSYGGFYADLDVGCVGGRNDLTELFASLQLEEEEVAAEKEEEQQEKEADA